MRVLHNIKQFHMRFETLLDKDEIICLLSRKIGYPCPYLIAMSFHEGSDQIRLPVLVGIYSKVNILYRQRLK